MGKVSKLLEEAKVVYSAGFFITVCPPAMKQAAEHCCKNGKAYCLNLSAPFICEVPPFKAVLDDLIPFCDVLFGEERDHYFRRPDRPTAVYACPVPEEKVPELG